MGSYNLHFIKTNKFKTVTISTNFRRPVDKHDITIRKFLFSTLCYSTKDFPTRRLMEIEQENLYLLNLSYGMQIFGNYVNSSVEVKVLKEAFSEPGMTRKSVKFLFNVLFNPNVDNKIFDKKAFDIIKNRMETEIKSIKDNTDLYSIIKVLEEMDNSNPTSFHTWGYLDDLNKISNETLYNYYLDVLNSDIIDIFIVGDIDIDSVKEAFKNNFLVNTLKRKKIDIYIDYNTYRKRAKKVMIEEPLLQQSKLSIACKVINISRFERKYVFPPNI
jgi:predicted Zn-dependent peptidase